MNESEERWNWIVRRWQRPASRGDVALSFTFPVEEFTTATWQPFVAWLEENHPDDLDAMLAGELSPDSLALFVSHGERTPRINPEATEIWRQHVAEFVAEQG